jgi:hypothetical protein
MQGHHRAPRAFADGSLELCSTRPGPPGRKQGKRSSAATAAEDRCRRHDTHLPQPLEWRHRGHLDVVGLDDASAPRQHASSLLPTAITAVPIGGWSRSREIFGMCGQAGGGGYPFVVRCSGFVRACGGLDGGGLPVTPACSWDLSPFYSLTLGPGPRRAAFCCRERTGQTSACGSARSTRMPPRPCCGSYFLVSRLNDPHSQH